jgi:hypothetical protein
MRDLGRYGVVSSLRTNLNFMGLGVGLGRENSRVDSFSTSTRQQHTDFIENIGERGGTRTLDPMIKSHVLYHLSYALTRRGV